MKKSVGIVLAILFAFTIISCGSESVAQKPSIDAIVDAPSVTEATPENVTTAAIETVEEIKEVVKEKVKKTNPKEIEAVQEFKKEVVEKVVKEKPKKKKKRNGPIIKFAETSHKFGIIEEGGQINHKFFFENTGKGDLFIKEATATCGCTVPSYPKTPIRTGETSYIRISFNTKEKTGVQKPVVTVYTNARKEPFKLRMEGEVIPKVDSDEAPNEDEAGH